MHWLVKNTTVYSSLCTEMTFMFYILRLFVRWIELLWLWSSTWMTLWHSYCMFLFDELTMHLKWLQHACVILFPGADMLVLVACQLTSLSLSVSLCCLLKIVLHPGYLSPKSLAVGKTGFNSLRLNSCAFSICSVSCPWHPLHDHHIVCQSVD